MMLRFKINPNPNQTQHMVCRPSMHTDQPLTRKLNLTFSTIHLLRHAHLQLDVALNRLQEVYADIKCEQMPCDILAACMCFAFSRELISFSVTQRQIVEVRINSIADEHRERKNQSKRFTRNTVQFWLDTHRT